MTKRVQGNGDSEMDAGQGGGLPRREFLKGALALGAAARMGNSGVEFAVGETGANDREYWLQVVEKVSNPVLEALSQGQLRAKMPVEAAPEVREERRKSTHLEAMGRLLCGLAPWLESSVNGGRERELQARYREWARAGIRYGTDKASADYMNFGATPQSLVDAAFLALALVRAPVELWEKLDKGTQANLVKALQDTRSILPGQSNWLLFSAMVEACLCFMGEWWDPMRVDYAIRQHQQWYVGDGMYGDGPHFHWDYYNSFVIHPMLLAVLETVEKRSASWSAFRPVALERSRRYAAIQERLISPESTFPAIGRSLAYRFGAFHLLSDIALRGKLPEGVAAEQVRCALTSVMRRMIEMPGTFDAKGWLTIGFAGHQPGIGESYISTGSTYLCAAAWLPMGLAETDAFWSGAAKPWTQAKAWSGQEVPLDHALAG